MTATVEIDIPKYKVVKKEDLRAGDTFSIIGTKDVYIVSEHQTREFGIYATNIGNGKAYYFPYKDVLIAVEVSVTAFPEKIKDEPKSDAGDVPKIHSRGDNERAIFGVDFGDPKNSESVRGTIGEARDLPTSKYITPSKESKRHDLYVYEQTKKAQASCEANDL